ncbi:hypothetical protein E4T66_03995 [Sinimarinibacterium sp. CAU 1509]|uniref:hypothetical protein n=1 Tax=Sinimarinibacterium sp. CAU 1509 TaxID=2562283 RepID=UPI0010AC4842|nr:hypothetical protein [Sinimarinibacterium sp. CAU 1509]TJY62890.1 hypothetical protein E4T66_03995 [Sinimarinibacterium sp. CAU 1509]
MRRVLLCSAITTAVMMLAACGGGDAPGAAPQGGDSGSHDPAVTAAAADGGCSWLVVSNPDLINVAFPDESATYWVAMFPALPGTRVRIDGQYPDARYFSFNVYDPALRPVDAITDYQLVPRVAGSNPYVTAGAAAGGAYVATVQFGDPPAERPANALYTNRIALPVLPAIPNLQITVIYRVYLGEGDAAGGVPLPQLVLENADGSVAPLRLSLCDPLPPDGLPSVLNRAIREASYPSLLDPVPYPLAPDEPRVIRFYGLPETLRVLASNAVGFDLPLQSITAADTGGGFLSNIDNAYVTAMASREHGDLYMVRARAPRYARDPVEAPLGSAQLRYWSICTNEFVSQRFVGCLADAQVATDDQGYFTLVVSDPDERPDNAVPQNGMDWLPWGGAYPDSVLIYRHMLPSPHFAEAIQNVPYGTPVEDVMGEYAPKVRYCDRATIEAASTAAQAFAACGE